MRSDELHRFARMGDVQALRRAIQAGADIDEQDEFGTTPLKYAIAEKKVEAALMLLECGADPVHFNKVSLTPLDIPKRKAEPALLQLLESKVVRKSS